jgi:hypothetical protein
MPVLLVTYSLKNKQKDYSELFSAIKANANGWWHYLDNTWVVNTNKSADEFTRELFPYIEKPDRLLVVKITGDHQGWLPKDAWNWLNNRHY